MIQNHKIIGVGNLLVQFPLIVEEETMVQRDCHLFQSYARKGQPLYKDGDLWVSYSTQSLPSVFAVVGRGGEDKYNTYNFILWVTESYCWIFFFSRYSFLIIIYLFLAVLGLHFCARAFSSCGKQGPFFIAVHGALTIAASLVAEHRLQTHRLSSHGARA